MESAPTVWPMPLKNPPRLVQAGRAVYGRKRLQEEFLLSELWCVQFHNYHGWMNVGGRDFEIQPGCVSVTPPNERIRYRLGGESWHSFAHFSLATAGDVVPMPAVQDLGENYAGLARMLEEAAGWLPAMPCRSSVRLWEVLWQLVTRPHSERAPLRPLHPALRQAVREVEVHMAEPLSIPEIAHRAEVSPNHLTRLFKAEFGATAEGYIRQRRSQRALHLLAHTTMAIKSIAHEVGLPDPHYFNKIIRAAAGCSPREYRGRHSAPARRIG